MAGYSTVLGLALQEFILSVPVSLVLQLAERRAAEGAAGIHENPGCERVGFKLWHV